MISIVLLYDYPEFGLSFLLIQSVGLLAIIFRKKPFKRNDFNIKNVLQEGVMLSIDVMLLLINYDVIPSNSIENVGWFLIALCCALIVYNLFFVVKDQIFGVKETIKSLRRFITSRKIKSTSIASTQETLNFRTNKRRKLSPESKKIEIPNFSKAKRRKLSPESNKIEIQSKKPASLPVSYKHFA